MHLHISCRPKLALQRLLGSHASRSAGVSASTLTPAPSLIPIPVLPVRQKPAAQMKKPRQRGVCDVLRF
ncbi:hypothetical protein A8E95_07495 [Burkholderia cenocepacia]|nr:hypothetical protein A8E96_12755 [Burkholderia cenocepacia]ONW36701.1 hypothetical protein A8E95_07495 [Burkholderia cenocepacia]